MNLLKKKQEQHKCTTNLSPTEAPGSSQEQKTEEKKNQSNKPSMSRRLDGGDERRGGDERGRRLLLLISTRRRLEDWNSSNSSKIGRPSKIGRLELVELVDLRLKLERELGIWFVWD